MIDRRTVLSCVTLIALMLAGAAWRMTMFEDWTVLAAQHRAVFWMLFAFPALSALMVGAMYLRDRANADVAKGERWRAWGAFVSISSCSILLLLQTLLIVMSLGLGAHLHLPAMFRTLVVLLVIMNVVAANQVPKLPYIERNSVRRFVFGGELGPIYGPRFVRTQARSVIVLAAAAIAFTFAATPVLFPLLATALYLVWLIAWGRHLTRKWQLEQSSAHRL